LNKVREEILIEMSRHAGIEGLRQVEAFWQKLIEEHGPHPLITKGLKRISKLIQFLEVGE
jgi:hypothetical protein